MSKTAQFECPCCKRPMSTEMQVSMDANKIKSLQRKINDLQKTINTMRSVNRTSGWNIFALGD